MRLEQWWGETKTFCSEDFLLAFYWGGVGGPGGGCKKKHPGVLDKIFGIKNHLITLYISRMKATCI